MYKSKLRLLGMSALIGAGLLAHVGDAKAYELRIGDFDVQIDTTASAGVSVRVADRDMTQVAEGNGGNPATKRLFNGATQAFAGTQNAVPAECDSLSSVCMPLDSTLAPVLIGLLGETASAALNVVADGDPDNFDTSINSDDSRLNFDSGDLTGGTFKLTSDIEASSGPWRVFSRITAFYDAVLMDDNSFERSGLDEAGEEEVGANIKLLDFFVDYEGKLGNVPYLIRAGKQVINWGESTFVVGGNSVFNAIDVPAFRRPGAEVKEALIPIEALFASASLTDNLSVEAYYGGWDSFIIDPSGSPFSGSDAVPGGAGTGGNNDLFFVGGGATSGSNNVNWDETYLGTAVAGTNMGNGQAPLMTGSAALIDAIQASTSPWSAFTTDHPTHYTQKAPVGEVETFRQGAYDTSWGRVYDREPGSEESLGLAIRYYAENLNSTEFGLYYQKHASRIPYVGFRANTPELGISTISNTADITTRGLFGAAACKTTNFGSTDPTVFRHSRELTDAVLAGITIGDDITDPNNLWGSIKTAAQAAHDAMADDEIVLLLYNSETSDLAEMLTTEKETTKVVFADRISSAAPDATAAQGSAAAAAALMGGDTLANLQAGYEDELEDEGYDAGTTTVFAAGGDWDNTSLPANFAYLEPTTPGFGAMANVGTFLGLAGYDGNFGANDNSYKSFVDAHCILGINGKISDSNTDADIFGDYAANGAMRPGINYQTDLFTYYPEDIEVIGLSAATTLFGWGVQGEIAFRPEFPLQIDADTVFISTASLQCAFPVFGDTGTDVYGILQTMQQYNCDETVGNQDVMGHVEQDVFNWDIGTTATFTRSNRLVSLLGADLGVLLTEFAGVIAPDIEDDHFEKPL